MINRGLTATAKTIRSLTIDAIEKANSGHPGLPMGCAEIGAFLFGETLKYYPKVPKWANRDRFILSAGHGSMLLYSLLFLSGYNVTLDDIKNFRQLKSKTPGHPEYGWTEGVETSTGPLGQGVANAVGMALMGKRNAQKFNMNGYTIFDNRIFVLASDGDLMEGLSYEAASLAGHLKLNNLILIYDSNKITIEGSVDLTFTENIEKRFRSQDWTVIKMNGHDWENIRRGFEQAEYDRIAENKPVIIIADTIIGKGSPNKQATNKCHGAPLGKDESELCKNILDIKEDFFVDPEAVAYFNSKKIEQEKIYNEWVDLFSEWSKKFPELRKLYDDNFSLYIPPDAFQNIPKFKKGDSIPTRNASQAVLNGVCKDLDFIASGSADLGSSTMTIIKDGKEITSDDYSKYNVQYGIREHAMGSIATGMYLYGGVLPVVGTFLSFVNYMLPSIRMAAIMRIPTIYLFSHDSIYVGEDGPTHQPVEHISSLRFMPNVNLMRPADANETITAWQIALELTNHPNIIITTRQKVPVLDVDFSIDNAKRGGFIIKKEKNETIDIILISSGSEVSITLEAAARLEKEGYSVRVVNMFSTYLFDRQSGEYKESVFPKRVRNRIAIEAGIPDYWYKYVGLDGDVIGVSKFGISGKAEEVGKFFGFTEENIYNRGVALIEKNR
ncbi:MAG TPA: transketolase [Spirochaetota bacterium]|nr:transketolase [Spirochaetota bacterium]HOS32776.1 transketolase [Spirochaetota bacterium]HOS56418.1 transketolase [Spirochaetota bacterium]HPK61816.1 transketolase [Spirochaetota bacterium]HQF76630.1 transketolase [Spirochaetota bacterium]